MNRPTVYDSTLRAMFGELYRDKDQLPGGTAGACEWEKRNGKHFKVTKAGERIFHFRKAMIFIKRLEGWRANHPGAVKHDRESATHEINMLYSALYKRFPRS